MSDETGELARRLRGGALYALVLLPVITDLLETGSLPTHLRGWLTEVVAGFVIAWLAYRVHRDMKRLEMQSMLDPLTGLGNRRDFAARARSHCGSARRTRLPLSLIYMDLDGFKHVNDELGHAAGDDVLRQVASAIRNSTRTRIDGGFRLGGDEFALLLPDTDATQAAQVMRRIEESCRPSGEHQGTRFLGIRISSGIAVYRPDQTVQEFVRNADQIMFAQKNERRCRPGAHRTSIFRESAGAWS